MEHPKKVLAKAEVWKRRAHRLSLQLRLKSLADTRKFLKEQGVALWIDKSDIPNVLDASLGRIARGRERSVGGAVENCNVWRKEILKEGEFLECNLFQKVPTVVHQDLWLYLAAVIRSNKEKLLEDNTPASKDAKKILTFLVKEGPSPCPLVRKALRIIDPRSFKKTRAELQNLLILTEEHKPNQDKGEVVLSVLENHIPKQIRVRAEQTGEKEARLKLLSATLHSSVLSSEKNVSRWFPLWKYNWQESIQTLVRGKDFLRVEQGSGVWIVPRKILTLKN